MLKRTLLVLGLVALLGNTFSSNSLADRCTTGRVTAVSATSISIYDRETLTFALDGRTRYTKWITNGRWQEATELHVGVLDVGQLVVVHPWHNDENSARWVQIATDFH